jgi:hypothetical protein
MSNHHDVMKRFKKYRAKLCKQPTERVVSQIREGDGLSTQAIALLNGEEYRSTRQRLSEAGIVEVLLDRLEPCGDPSVEAIVLLHAGNVVSSPTVLMKALLTFLKPDSLPAALLLEKRLVVANRLKALSECMVDPKREFFKSRSHWQSAVILYIELLPNLVHSPETIPILVDNQAVADFVVQALFWGIFRPDITEEINEQEKQGNFPPDCLGRVLQLAAVTLCKFFEVPTGKGPLNDAELQRFTRLGDTSAVNVDYTGEKVTLLTGLLDAMKQNFEEAWTLASLFYVLGQLESAVGISSMGRGAIVKLVELGKTVPSADAANIVVMTLYNSLARDDAEGIMLPNDELFAQAIKEGMLEMILETLVKYGHDAKLSIQNTRYLLHKVGVVALARKSGKVLRDRAAIIRAEAQGVLRSNHGVAAEEARTVLAILDKAEDGNSKASSNIPSTIRCRWCEITISPCDVKQCSACQRAHYCSKECQVQDWKEGGHKMMCKRMMAHGVKAQSRGASKKEIKSVKRLEENVCRAGEKLFKERGSDIFLQAALRGYDIADCVTTLNFCKTPPTIETQLATEYLEWGKKHSDQLDEYEHAKRNIENDRRAGALSLVFLAHPVDPSIPIISMHKSVRAPPNSPSWSELQRETVRDLGPSLDKIRSNPEERDQFLKQLMTASRD